MKPRFALFALLPIALFLLPAGVFWVDRSIAEGEVPRNVSIAGIDVSGLSYDDAILTIQAYEQQLQTTPAVFTVNESVFRLDPSSVSVEADEVTAVEEAIAQRTDGGAISRFWSWLGGFSKPVDVRLPITMDRAAIEDQLSIWQDVAIPNPAYEGSVAVVDAAVVVEYPQAGERLEIASSAEIVVETLSVLPGREARLPVVEHRPEVTNSDVDAAAVRVRRIINSDVVLTNDDIGYSQTFTPEEISRAVYTEISTDPVDVMVLIDEAVVHDLIDPYRSEFELPPVSAEFKATVSSGEVYFIPGRYGTVKDVPAVAEELLRAAEGAKRGPFPVSQGDEPRLTNEEAEAYGPMGLVSKFTTNMPGKNRVHNIQLMADTVDESVVFPGETFSINDVVGQRTLEKGYLEDCAIINGEVVCEGHPANIGGGVSQFSTTLYNAVFYGCYEDVKHKPHSLYFKKYPEVIEATMGYPDPDVVFRNNSDAPVIIRTAYTSSTITVLFYGNNGGKECTAEWGERTNPEEYETVYVSAADEEDLDLDPGQEKRIQSGIDGFTQTVTRIITQPDGTKERERTWSWRYLTQDEKIAVHACMVTGEPVNCPEKLPSLVGTAYDGAYDQLRA
ncbi:MAG: VanW family protein, partial [Actinomycetia bacterium]|nr:VanW family protein [Actinomycetes bacterium]